MNQLQIEEIIGKDLSQELIKFMVDTRIREYGENTRDFENDERESAFFFLKDGNDIKAFGMLKPVSISIDSKVYQIMGMANVIAMEKSKGYGTNLMDYVKKYLEKHKLACIGNTHKDNFEFYKKCGFSFISGLVERFIYIDDEGHKHGGDWTDYCMFVYDPSNKLNEVINDTSEIITKIPLW